MKVTALKCNNCNTLVYSRTRHDFQTCMCFANEVGNGGCAIDGGFDYCKVSAGTNSDYEFVANYDLGEITREMLYEDWATGTDSYGRVENESR